MSENLTELAERVLAVLDDEYVRRLDPNLIRDLARRVVELEAVVKWLPKTADGVVGSDMMTVHSFRYEQCGETGTVAMRVNYEGGWDSLAHWYSTRKAAEAARADESDPPVSPTKPMSKRGPLMPGGME